MSRKHTPFEIVSFYLEPIVPGSPLIHGYFMEFTRLQQLIEKQLIKYTHKSKYNVNGMIDNCNELLHKCRNVKQDWIKQELKKL